MWVTPLELIQILSRRMWVGWPKCGSDPRDEGHLACLQWSKLMIQIMFSSPPTHAGYCIGGSEDSEELERAG